MFSGSGISFTVVPPFITNLICWSIVMSVSGSPSTAIRSAYFPASTAPTRSCQPSNSAALTVAARIASRDGMPRLVSATNYST